MIEAPRGLCGIEAVQILLNRGAAVRDDETRLATSLRRVDHAADDLGTANSFKSTSSKPTAEPRAADLQTRRIADFIRRTVEGRLPGRIRDFEVRVEQNQFVLSGVSSSYYVKQMAQHLAMTALDKRMLGRLVNEIDVRTMR
jgi:hypothetical protein